MYFITECLYLLTPFTHPQLCLWQPPVCSNCGAGEVSWESLGLQGAQTSQSKGNQPWIFIGRTDTEAEYFGHLMQRANSLVKTLMLGKIEGRRRRGRQGMRRLDSITDTMDMNLSKLREIMENRGARCATVLGVAKSRRWLTNNKCVLGISFIYFACAESSLRHIGLVASLHVGS